MAHRRTIAAACLATAACLAAACIAAGAPQPAQARTGRPGATEIERLRTITESRVVFDKSPEDPTLGYSTTYSIEVFCHRVKGASGFQLAFSKKASFTNAKKAVVKGDGGLRFTWKAPSSGKWWVKVRTMSKSGKRTVYGKWSKAKSVKVKAGEKSPEKVPLKYHYRLRLIDRPHTPRIDDCKRGIRYEARAYLETDNPDPESIQVISDAAEYEDDETLESAPRHDKMHAGIDWGGAGEFIDLKNCTAEVFTGPGNDGRACAFSTGSGYAASLRCDDMEGDERTLYVVERGEGTIAVGVLGKVRPEDGEKALAASADALIAKVCDPSLPKGDQMQQLADYMLAHSYYGPEYFLTDKWQIGIIEGGRPGAQDNWAQVVLDGGYVMKDSTDSAPDLVYLGKRLGYPLEDFTGKYDWATQYYQWKWYHARVYSAADDRYFYCCPSAQSCLDYYWKVVDGNGGTWPEFDFLTYDKYIDID